MTLRSFYLITGQTVNQHVYKKFLKGCRKEFPAWEQSSWTPGHCIMNSAACYRALSVNEFLQWEIFMLSLSPVNHLAWDLAITFSSWDWKTILKDSFGNIGNIKENVTDQLKEIQVSEFHYCYEECKVYYLWKVLDGFPRELLWMW